MACESFEDATSSGCVSLSDFQDEIIHHIFSFMEPNYTAKVCTLSKRFHNLCKTSPYLNFYCDDWPVCHCENFIRSFRRFLKQRGGLKVQRVCFTVCCNCAHSSLFHKLQDIVLEYNVDEVVLHHKLSGRQSTHIYFPATLFQNQRLKVLEIYFPYISLRLQPLKLNNYLQVLTLHLAEVNNSVAEYISDSCPFLKCLTIKQDIEHSDKPKYGLFIIKSSSLEELRITGINHKHVRVMANKLQSLYIEQNEEYAGKYVFVEINAPNIQNLTWLGALLKLRFIEGLKMLRKAIIDVKPQQFGQPPDASLCQFLFELLEALQRARSLHLSNWFIKFLVENNCIPTDLGNVRHLSLLMWDTMTSSFVSSVAPFMKKLTSVEVLHIRKSFLYENHENLELLRDSMPVQPLKEFDIYPKFYDCMS